MKDNIFEKKTSAKCDFELLSEEEVNKLETEQEDSFVLEELGVFEEFSEILLEAKIQEKLPMAFRLMRRFVIFLSFLMASLLIIFFIGNEQHFLDSDLRLVLSVNTFVSIMLALMCISAFFLCIICIFLERKIKYVFYSVAFVTVFVLSAASSILVRSINMISEGFAG